MAGSYCKSCGAQLGESAWYCKICGTPTDELYVICSTCGEETSAGGGFCQNCGAILKNTPATGTRDLSRLRLKYHPLWIPVASLFATFLSLVMAHFLWQLHRGGFPREGLLWSALIIAVFACAAFYLGRALRIAGEGFCRGEYKAAKKEYMRLQKSGPGQKRNGFLVFLRARPLAAALALFICVALCAGLLLPPAAEPPGAEAGQPEAAADTPAAPGAPADSVEGEALSESTGEALRLIGAWTNFSGFTDQTIYTKFVYDFVCFAGDTAITGTCNNTEDLEAYLKSGVISNSMTVHHEYSYVVKEASFLDVKNLEEDYLYYAVIELYDAGGTLASTWDLGFLQTITKRDVEGPSLDNWYQTDKFCSYSFIPAKSEATEIVTAELPGIQGVWVLDSEYRSYTRLDSHNSADIPFVYFESSDVMYMGCCTGASAMLDFILSSPEIPEGVDPIECSYTCEDIVYALNPDWNYPVVDSGRIYVAYKPGDEPDVLWELRTGSILHTDGGSVYYWGEDAEYKAIR